MGLDAFCCGGVEESSVLVTRVFWPRPVKDRWPPVVHCCSATTVAPQLLSAGEGIRAAAGCRRTGPSRGCGCALPSPGQAHGMLGPPKRADGPWAAVVPSSVVGR